MRCFVCKNDEWNELYSGLCKCKSCGFIRAEDNFFNIQPSKIYERKYYTNGEYLNYKKERNALEKNFSGRIEEIIKYKREGKLLEIGCAYGYFLNIAKIYFNTIGIELDSTTQKIAKDTSGQKVIRGDFLKIRIPKNSYDVICMFDVIEHLINPAKYLSKIKKTLKKDGLVVIETGDIESSLAKFQKEKWRLINPDVHLSYFSRKTLTELLNGNGFEVLDVKYVGFSRTIAQVIYKLTGYKKLPNILFKIYPKINFYDLMLVVAQKRFN